MDRRREIPEPAGPEARQAAEIASLLAELPRTRREWFRHRLRRCGRGGPGGAAVARELREAVAELQARRAMPLELGPPEGLPIAAEWARLQEILARRRVVVVEGETGSGKSTQLPRLCAAMGRGIEGRIVVTEPRRIAARAIARRLAESCGTPLGSGVGYRTRFESRVSAGTRIEVATDGVLAAMLRRDRLLRAYDTVIIDEAHERSVTIDLLLGAMRLALRVRRDLRVIVSSATLATESLASFLGDAPVVSIAGRQHPVEIRHAPISRSAESEDPEGALLDAAGAAVHELLAESRGERGDLLVFLPGERQIRDLHEQLAGGIGAEVELLPLYARLDAAAQDRAFAEPAGMRVILATNVAETSLTLPWVRAVVDTGLARVARFDPRRRVQRLRIEPISRASAAQRAGRCGRVGPGVCVRLYAESDLDRRPEFTPPELLRCGLAGVILQLSHLRLGPIESFPFPDPPSPARIAEGVRTLWEVGAIETPSADAGQARGSCLTEIGRRLASLPLDPRLARVVLGGIEEDCLAAAALVASFLSVQDPRTGGSERDRDPQDPASERSDPFRDGRSDLLSILRLGEAWQRRGGDGRRATAAWCRRHGLNPARMREWAEVHRQLRGLLERRWRVRFPTHESGSAAAIEPARLHRAALRGLVGLIAAKERAEEEGDRPALRRQRGSPADGDYLSADGARFSIWPGSVLARERPPLLLAAEIVETQRRWGRTVAPIRSQWVERIAPHLLQRERFEPHFLPESGQVAAWERVRLGAVTIVPRRRVPFGPVDPAAARQVFIAAGLVEERWQSRGSFRRHNRRLLEELAAAEARTRRPAAVLREGAVFAFFDRVIPPGIHSGPAFEAWRRRAEQRDPGILRMGVGDLAESFAWPDPREYPETLLLEGEGTTLELPVRYRHEPGAPRDGVTVAVPLEAIETFERLAPQRLPWLVPGMLLEKVESTIRSLPKSMRIRLGSAREAAAAAIEGMLFGAGHLPQRLAAALSRRGGEAISTEEVAAATLRAEPWLRIGVELLDRAGGILDFRRDGESWSRPWAQEARRRWQDPASASAESRPWTVSRIESLPESPLPRSVAIRVQGVEVAMHPTLTLSPDGESVSLGLCADPHEADASTGEAVARLFARESGAAISHHLEYHPLALEIAGHWPRCELQRPLTLLIASRCFGPELHEIRGRAAFEQRLEQRLPRLFELVEATLRPIADAARRGLLLRSRLREPAPQAWAESIAAIASELERSLALESGELPSWAEAEIDLLPAGVEALRRRFERLRGGGSRSEAEAIARFESWRRAIDELPLHPSDRRRRAVRWGILARSIAVSAPELAPASAPTDATLAREVEALLAASAHRHAWQARSGLG